MRTRAAIALTVAVVAPIAYGLGQASTVPAQRAATARMDTRVTYCAEARLAASVVAYRAERVEARMDSLLRAAGYVDARRRRTPGIAASP